MEKLLDFDVVNDEIVELEELAQTILTLREKNSSQQRRPLLIEFCGTPKAGKTSTINALNIFLKRNNFKTVLLTERASICPVKEKQKPFFNIWTACSTLAEILKNLSSNYEFHNIDVILSDRGLFDSLSWFFWLKKRGSLNHDDFVNITSFFTMSLFSRYLDLVFIFMSSPEVSMRREYANLLTRKEGSIMNRVVLSEYNESLIHVQEMFQNRLKKLRFEVINTDSNNQSEVGKIVTKRVLENLKEVLEEKIGYFSQSIAQYLRPGILSYKNYDHLFGEFCIESGGTGISLFSYKTQDEYLQHTSMYYEPEQEDLLIRREEKIRQYILYGNRNFVEKEEYIQPIPIAVITNKSLSKILLVKKKSKTLEKDSPEKNKVLLYVGGHIRNEDDNEWGFFNVVKNTLERELEEELNLSLRLDQYIEIPYIIYDPTKERSKKHVAICFIIKLDVDNLVIHPDPRELLKKSDSNDSGSIIDISEIEKRLNNGTLKTEFWSLQILKEIFHVEVPVQTEFEFPDGF
jgi:predicted NUDIX family phosphoesterase/thymidylate kinase